MGYRGSKSITGLYTPNSIKPVIVKEQRVDGSWQVGGASCLRCTLTGFERNYQVRNPSKQINKDTKRYYSSNSVQQCVLPKGGKPNLFINPWFITGLVDALGGFNLIIKTDNYDFPRFDALFFQIALYQKDTHLLDLIKEYFGVGEIYSGVSQPLFFCVSSFKDLKVIINHFDKYPLFSKTSYKFYLFKLAFNIILNREHLTMVGLRKLENLYLSMVVECDNKIPNPKRLDPH